MGAGEMTFQTKQEWIYGKLKDSIENCDLKPGERIFLDQVASEYKVSRIPVREALLQLQVEGLVEMVPHCGAVVSPVDFSSAVDYYAISRELQVLAVKACIDRASDEEIRKISKMVSEMEKAAAKDDRDEYTRLNHVFHDYIVELSRMPLLSECLGNFQQRWHRFEKYYHLYPMSVGRMQQTMAEHREILSAIENRDKDAAEKAVRTHNITGLEDHLNRMKEVSGRTEA